MVVWLVPGEYRALRIGAVLYAAFAVAVFVIPTPLGGNVTRLGALFAGPVLLLVLWPRGRWVVLAVSLPLLYWQLIAPVRDVRKASGDDSTQEAFYEPLIAELDRLAAARGTFRVEIPPTRNRWEAAYVAERYPIARGWLRQLESDDFDLFKDGTLDAEAYRDWLADHAVSYVAVPDAPRDVLAEDEVDLIDGGLEYLEPIWEDDDWSLYAVDGSDEFGLAGQDVTGLSLDSFTLEGRGRVHPGIDWSRLWRPREGEACARATRRRLDVDRDRAAETGGGRAGPRRELPARLSQPPSSTPSNRSSSGIVSAASRCRTDAIPTASAPSQFSRRSSTKTASPGSTPSRSQASR